MTDFESDMQLDKTAHKFKEVSLDSWYPGI